MTPNIDDLRTGEDALRLLEAAVAVRGEDFIYRDHYSHDAETFCRYVERNTDTGEEEPGCIVGLALHLAGVPLPKLRGFEGWPSHTVAGELLDLDRRGRMALYHAQKTQDDAGTWGESLAAARLYLESVKAT